MKKRFGLYSIISIFFLQTCFANIIIPWFVIQHTTTIIILIPIILIETWIYIQNRSKERKKIISLTTLANGISTIIWVALFFVAWFIFDNRFSDIVPTNIKEAIVLWIANPFYVFNNMWDVIETKYAILASHIAVANTFIICFILSVITEFLILKRYNINQKQVIIAHVFSYSFLIIISILYWNKLFYSFVSWL
jgi:hypothetical protein